MNDVEYGKELMAALKPALGHSDESHVGALVNAVLVLMGKVADLRDRVDRLEKKGSDGP